MRYLDVERMFVGQENIQSMNHRFPKFWMLLGGSRGDTNEASDHDVYQYIFIPVTPALFVSWFTASFSRTNRLSISSDCGSLDSETRVKSYFASHLHNIYCTDIKSISYEALSLRIAAVRLATNTLHIPF